MSLRYALYGLTIGSAEPLSALGPPLAAAPAHVDVTVDFEFGRYEEDVTARSVPLGPARGATRSRLSVAADGFHLIYESAHVRTVYSIGRRGAHVRLHVEQEFLLRNALELFAHPVMAYVARLHGRRCLHANVMAHGGMAFALLGRSGLGKSTLSAALSRVGCRLLSEDVGALAEQDGIFRVHGGVRRLRTSRAVAARLAADGDAVTAIFEDHFGQQHGKVYIEAAHSAPAGTTPLPLRCVYVLQPRSERLKEPVIAPVSAADALPLLALNTSGREILDRAGVADDYAALARLARSVPVRTLACPDGIEHLARTGRAVIADMLAHAPPA